MREVYWKLFLETKPVESPREQEETEGDGELQFNYEGLSQPHRETFGATMVPQSCLDLRQVVWVFAVLH